MAGSTQEQQAKDVTDMPLRSNREPRRSPEQTINGYRSRTPEGPGTVQRRVRLFAECARRLADEPLASPDAREIPIGEGLGLDELIPIIEPVFEKEPSMIRWTALRGAIAALYIDAYDRTSRQVLF